MKEVNHNHYLSGKELYYEIIVSKAKGDLTKKAENMFILLVERVHRKMWYNDPQISEDCLHTAYEHIFDKKKWMSFNEERSTNSFAYFTEITKRGLAKGWNNFNKVRGLKENPIIFSIESINQGDGMINI